MPLQNHVAMNRVLAIFFLLFTLSFVSTAQESKKVFTIDIDNFWIAYDSIQTTRDSL